MSESVFLGSAYGMIDIKTGKAHQSILGIDSALIALGQTMGGINPIAIALGGAIIGVGAAIGGVVSIVNASVDQFADMQAQLSDIQAVSGATTEETEQLKNLITDLGLDPKLKVSATEAADAIEMLLRNGLSIDDVLNGAARSTILLANATGGDFSKAADTVTDVMAQFGIQASDMKKAVDGIVSVIQNSKLDINDYAYAIGMAGGVAGGSGVEFADFNTVLAGTAANFSGGSDAGTSFKVFLQRLVPNSKKAAKEMQRLGMITEDGANRFFDAEGNLRDLDQIAFILSKTLGDLSEQERIAAMHVIFGTDASRTAQGLMELGDASGYANDGIEGFVNGFTTLQETMAQTDADKAAAIRMDNLKGSAEILDGIIETLKISIGEEFEPAIRSFKDTMAAILTEHGDEFIAFFGALADVFEQSMPAVEGVAGAVGNLAGAFADFVATGNIDTLLETWDAIASGSGEGAFALGEQIGQYIAEGIIAQFNGDDEAIADSIAAKLVRINKRIGQDLLLIGGEMVAGIFAGMINKLTGGDLEAQTITEFRKMWDWILNGIDWPQLGRNLIKKIFEGLGVGEKGLSLIDELLPNLNPITFGKNLLSGNIPGTNSTYTPPTANSASAEETNSLLRQLNGKLKGTANFVVNEDALKDSGFIHADTFNMAAY